VQRREYRELVDRPLHLVVDESGTDEAAPTVHDAVAHGVRCDEVLHGTRFVPADEVKLETRGAGVHDQDVHLKGFS
jgi:hypothetical protein